MVRWWAEAPERTTVLTEDHCATTAKVYLLMINRKVICYAKRAL
jgi:hypothetical protein